MPSIANIALTWLAARILAFALFDPLPSLFSGDAALFFAGSSSQAPGYSWLLALAGPWSSLALQSLGTLAAAALAYDRLPRHGLLVALLIAGSPFFIVYEWRILSDALAWQLVWAAFLLLAFPKSPWEKVAAGIMLGLAALTRDTYYYLPLFALPFAYWAGIGRRMAIAAGIALLTVLPWQVANNRLAISEGRLGYNLWVGTWEREPSWMLPGLASADYPATAFTSPEQRAYLLERPLMSLEANQRFKDAAIGRITADPDFVLTNWALRYPRLWLGTRSDQIDWRLAPRSPLWLMLKAALWLLNFATVVVGFAGLYLAGRRYPLLAVPPLYLAMVYLPFHNTEPRYTIGALPFLYLFAVAAIKRQWGGDLK